MSNLVRALSTLEQMARLLDSVSLAASSRYDRLTNEYQAELESAYRNWSRNLVRDLANATDDLDRKKRIEDAALTLRLALEAVGNEYLPYAVSAIGAANYIPSPDAWRMIAEAIDSQNKDFDARLIPFIVEKLKTSIDEQTDLQSVADSLITRVSYYAGNLWIVIQKLVGDFANQAATRDDLIYRCRWVRVHDDHSCESCQQFEGEYDSYEAMLQATNQCVPGYFETSPFKSCWLNCRCYIELYINGKWVRI